MSFPSASDMKGTSYKYGSQLVRPFMWLLCCQKSSLSPLRHKFISTSSFSSFLLKALIQTHWSCQPLYLLVSHGSERITRPDQSEDSLCSRSDWGRESTTQVQVIRTRPPPTVYSNNQQSILFSSQIGREKEDGVGHYQGLLLMPFGDHVPENGADAAREEEWAPLTVWPPGFSHSQASLRSELPYCVSYRISSSTDTIWSCLMPPVM